MDDNKQIEDLRNEIIELKSQLEAVTGERDALKSENDAQKQRIDSLLDTNSKLYLKVSTPVEDTETPEPTQQDLINSIVEQLANSIK